MSKFVCTVCGYVHEGDSAPEQCPVCKVGADKFEEVKDFKECALCGTAAVLSPVGRIDNKDQSIFFEYNDGIGEISKKLYDTLVGIQMGTIEAPEGWIREVKL